MIVIYFYHVSALSKIAQGYQMWYARTAASADPDETPESSAIKSY